MPNSIPHALSGAVKLEGFIPTEAYLSWLSCACVPNGMLK